MGADKRKAELSDSDDDFAPSAEASPEVKPKPKKKSKPKAADTKKPKPELADDDDDVPLKDRKSAKDEKQKKGLFGRMSSVVSPLERTLKQMPGKAFDAARKMPGHVGSWH